MYTPFFRKGGRCFRASPAFNIKPDKKRRFDNSLIISVRLCPFNHAQVIICKALSKKLRPFPTTFWLTCPHLIKLAGTVESQGGVHELEEYLKNKNLFHEWHRYNFLHQVIRLNLIEKNLKAFMKKYRSKIFRGLIRGGIGGIKYGEDLKIINVKCLHLQAASCLVLGFHPGKEWLEAKGLCSDCGRGLCSIINKK